MGGGKAYLLLAFLLELVSGIRSGKSLLAKRKGLTGLELFTFLSDNWKGEHHDENATECVVIRRFALKNDESPPSRSAPRVQSRGVG